MSTLDEIRYKWSQVEIPAHLLPFLPSTAGLYAWYVGVMKLKAKREELERGNKLLYGIAWLAVFGFALADVWYNWTRFSFVVREFPHEFMTTSRLKRLRREGNEMQRQLCTWICEVLLNPEDPSGKHC